MVEFCLKCWNELNGTNDGKDKYILSEEFDLCENCGEYTRVIIGERRITRCDKPIQKFLRLKK